MYVPSPSGSTERRDFFVSVINHLQVVDLSLCVCNGGYFNWTFEPGMVGRHQNLIPNVVVIYHFSFLGLDCSMYGGYFTPMNPSLRGAVSPEGGFPLPDLGEGVWRGSSPQSIR